MKEYIEEKVKILHQLGYHNVTKSDFSNAKNEVQVDQIAHRIMME